MSINNDWDVEKHKTEHECDEHWELRRKFLLTHKKKFPENELVCLAQVFSNVELLGCRYPKETMDLVAELSKEIAAEFREKQKTKLQRTFVKASEAASSKVKGCTQTSNITEKPISKQINKKTEIKMVETVNNHKRPSTSIMKSSPKKIRKPPFGDIILVERPGDAPQNILFHSVGLSKNNLKWTYTNQSTNLYNCTIYINSKRVACVSGYNRKNAKKKVAALALDKLRKYYHTIKVKQNSDNAQTNVNLTTIKKTQFQDNMPDGNIGKKLMKLMGWSGGGLGKSQQGIVEPVTLKQQLSRKGLGLSSNSSNMHELKVKCRTTFKEFLMGDMQNDIAFSTDFTNDERAMIHQVAQSMGLKSRSHGPSNQRRLIISRKVNIRNLVEELKSLGGSTEKYELIEPTSLDEEWESSDETTEKYELREQINLDEDMMDLDGTTEKYKSIEPTSSLEKLNTRCIAKTSTITKKSKSKKSNKKLKSKIENIETVNNCKRPNTSVIEFSPKKKRDLPHGNIILLKKPGEPAKKTLIESVGKKNVKWVYTKNAHPCGCIIYINSKQIAHASGDTRKRARNNACEFALKELQKYYYTVKIKPKSSNAQTNVTLMMKEKTKFQDNIPDSNLEKNLMNLTDWSDECFRKSQESIVEPVTRTHHVTRENLDLKTNSSNRHELKDRCKNIFQEFLTKHLHLDELVFGADFSKNERTAIIQLASSMDLKLHSYGSNNYQILVITRKVNVQSVVDELKSLGGTNEKYELIEPTILDEEPENPNGTTEKNELIEIIDSDEEMKDFEGTLKKYKSIEPTRLIEKLMSLDRSIEEDESIETID